MLLNKKEYYSTVSYWLISLLLFLVLIVIVGGLTRLTDSGLSITTWDVVKGILPPLNQNDWNEMFDLYKKIPQFILINENITLAEFKVIYYWEYIHRILGRLFGLLFLIPFIYFIFKKVFTKEFNLKFTVLFLLILFQGFIGWDMVQSGLVENTTVSHFRLALHLNLALVLFVSIFWYFLNLRYLTNKYFFSFSKSNFASKFLVILIFLQITFGAFTSGLDAGQLYQTWPLMNQNYFPDDLILKNIKYIDFISDPSAVQFLHRNLAYIITLYVIIITMYFFIRKEKYLYKYLYFLVFMIFLQVVLGILTLVSGLNIIYASMHQISTTLLLISSIMLCYNLKN